MLYIFNNCHTSSFSDGRYYETTKANFERADRTTVVRTTTNCHVSNYYLLSNYKDLIFNWEQKYMLI
jgi:formate-dependent nitrite reductase cytochrome c552 subunit